MSFFFPVFLFSVALLLSHSFFMNHTITTFLFHFSIDAIDRIFLVFEHHTKQLTVAFILIFPQLCLGTLKTLHYTLLGVQTDTGCLPMVIFAFIRTATKWRGLKPQPQFIHKWRFLARKLPAPPCAKV